ncbi:uncharacterized protein LOC133422555 [Cololabis saira]|uniref:uncharacterized protein LOC133422555 n=1 Tax=Cololabis saira TaxID=129043 RepID=UPI002AD4746D|nr:uncharacterized protein LOC133422555 [Cololabis saira]
MKTCVVLALFLMAGVSLGDIQKRVNNGRKCTADETKSFVFITECSGTVIGNGNWIITAKHCEDDGGLDRLIRWFSPTKIKDVTLTQTITLEKTFKHATADVMLIKVNTSMEGMPLVPEAVCSQVLNQISPTNTVPMVVPARHTKEEDKTWKDVSMCADINVNGRGTIRKTNVLLWSPDGCDTCKLSMHHAHDLDDRESTPAGCHRGRYWCH